jgi:hypothetical protein
MAGGSTGETKNNFHIRGFLHGWKVEEDWGVERNGRTWLHLHQIAVVTVGERGQSEVFRAPVRFDFLATGRENGRLHIDNHYYFR